MITLCKSIHEYKDHKQYHVRFADIIHRVFAKLFEVVKPILTLIVRYLSPIYLLSPKMCKCHQKFIPHIATILSNASVHGFGGASYISQDHVPILGILLALQWKTIFIFIISLMISKKDFFGFKSNIYLLNIHTAPRDSAKTREI